MIHGRCLCGGIRFEVDADLGPVDHCHCSQCRRASGSAFATNAPVPRAAVRFTTGEDLVREFESAPGKLRAFCSRCGSPVHSRLDADPHTLRLRLGLLDGDPARGVHAHIWVGSKAAWHPITDDLPRFEKDPPPGSGR